jgi:radical SAM protein with 4Fe4S-binding SPASM domain
MAPRRLLLRLFRHLEQTATFVDLSTNGSLLDSKLISSMLPVLANIHFSVEAATPETYHKIRGSRAFYSVIDTIKMMTELKHEVPKGERPFNVILNYALRKSNCSELIDFLRMAAEWRVDGVFVRQLLVHFPSMKSETLVDKPEILNPLIEQAEQEAEKLGLSVILPAYIKRTQSANTLSQASKSAGTSQTEPQNKNDTRKPKRINCSFLWRCMNIRSTGHIFACNALNAPLLGNLETKTFADMWNGEILREMRKRLDTSDPHPVCRACWMYEVGYLDSFDTSDSQRNFSLKTAAKPREKSYNVSAFIQEKIDDA